MHELSLQSVKASDLSSLPEYLFPSLFTSPRWLKLLTDQYDFEFLSVQIPETPNRMLAARVDQFGISKIISLPFCDYTIPSVSSAEALDGLIRKLEETYPDLPIRIKMVLPPGIRRKRISVPLEHTAYRHIVDTGSGMNALEKKMDNSFMRGVRKAESHNLNISFERSREALNTFYRIYSEQRIHKFGKLPQPRSFFKKLRHTFFEKDKGFILQASKGSKIIAAMLILIHNDTLYYKFGCSHPDYLDLRPNNLLFHHLFSYACKNGFPMVDLGLSGTGESYKGLVRFKEYMGGEPSNIYSLELHDQAFSRERGQLDKFITNMTEAIVDQEPDPDRASVFSENLYPLFA